jgi:hypothetical protein
VVLLTHNTHTALPPQQDMFGLIVSGVVVVAGV